MWPRRWITVSPDEPTDTVSPCSTVSVDRHRQLRRVQLVRDRAGAGALDHLAQRLPVVAVPVGGDDGGQRRVADQLEQPVGLVGRVDQQPLAGGPVQPAGRRCCPSARRPACDRQRRPARGCRPDRRRSRPRCRSCSASCRTAYPRPAPREVAMSYETGAPPPSDHQPVKVQPAEVVGSHDVGPARPARQFDATTAILPGPTAGHHDLPAARPPRPRRPTTDALREETVGPGRYGRADLPSRRPERETPCGRPSRRARRARAQPQGRPPRPAPRQPDRVHRAVRVGQVQPGLRHDLRRGPAPLRGVAVARTRGSSSARWTSPTSTSSRACRRRSRSTRSRPPATRGRPSARSPRSTTTSGCSTRGPAGRTARSAAGRSPGRPRSRSSTGCWRWPRAPGSRCSPR